MPDVIYEDWTTEPPKEAGFYWFYGDPFHGGMGINYRDNKPPTEPEMCLVEVFNISNGVMAKSHGQFVPLRKFNIHKHVEGPLGYWKKAELPVPPPDVDGLFNPGPEWKLPTESEIIIQARQLGKGP